MKQAEKLYSASVWEDPDIPLTVFTKNIDTILVAKRIQKRPDLSKKDIGQSPASSLTGMTSKTSKSSIGAWKVPLQQSRSPQPATTPKQVLKSTARELQQQRLIENLEAKLASLSAGNSQASASPSIQSQRAQSRSSSQLSGNSPNSLATAHARLDGIETTVLKIQSILESFVSDRADPPPPQQSDSVAWPTLASPQRPIRSPATPLAPASPSPGTQLALLSAVHSPPKQKAPKRHKASTFPSDQRSQYKDTMSSGGETSF